MYLRWGAGECLRVSVRRSRHALVSGVSSISLMVSQPQSWMCCNGVPLWPDAWGITRKSFPDELAKLTPDLWSPSSPTSPKPSALPSSLPSPALPSPSPALPSPSTPSLPSTSLPPSLPLPSSIPPTPAYETIKIVATRVEDIAAVRASAAHLQLTWALYQELGRPGHLIEAVERQLDQLARSVNRLSGLPVSTFAVPVDREGR